eukprot:285838_1
MQFFCCAFPLLLILAVLLSFSFIHFSCSVLILALLLSNLFWNVLFCIMSFLLKCSSLSSILCRAGSFIFGNFVDLIFFVLDLACRFIAIHPQFLVMLIVFRRI